MNIEPIAIVGLGCRFPGAEGPAALWQLLKEGKSGITEIPRDRWDVDAFYRRGVGLAGKMNTRWGGFLPDIENFDARFFGVSPGEASSMDPQQRLLLEVAWQALENACLTPERLRGTKTGVFVGISGNDYASFSVGDFRKMTAYSLTGNTFSIAANRVSHFFDFRGPSIALDTACSSSLAAIHLACRSLQQGDSEMALAGGVNVILTPNASVAMSHAWVLSPEGKCKAFDADADGYVRSEGCGFAVLKKLSDAERDGDPVLAIIRGSAINQDGHGERLTVPHADAQRSVIEQAFAQADISPARVHYIEAHGVGSPLTDSAEMQAINAVLAERSPETERCVVGSVKTNIGHCEAAAGIAALIKVVEVLRHRESPGNLHHTRLHPDLAPFSGKVLVNAENVGLGTPGSALIAGVNSFGIGGTNVHIVLESRPESKDDAEDQTEHILTFSARTALALDGLRHRYVQFLGANRDIPFAAICRSSNLGRTHFSYRSAVVARDAEEALQILNGDSQERSNEIAHAYLSGANVDWVSLHKGRPWRRVALPNYPFERKRYSVREATAQKSFSALPEQIRHELASIVGIPPAEIVNTTGFYQLGLTSLMVAELHRRIQAIPGVSEFPATAIFDHPNIDALSNFLTNGDKATPQRDAPPAQGLSGHDSIAIIGMGCRMPGGITTPEGFWALLREGVDAIREVPSERWDAEAFFDADPDTPGRMYTTRGGFLDSVDQFDAQFFGIAPREAISLDPQQRLLLEVAWEALENAGLAPSKLAQSPTGTFVGAGQHDYLELISKLDPSAVDAHYTTGNILSAAAGRIAFTLGLHGPALAVDTACSSSLVALHLACQSLRRGECDHALAGAVGLMLSPDASVRLCRTKALSPQGRCAAFDASADGYVRGEGCGVVVLKRLADAQRDNDRILAVIRGSSVNHDGASGGFTVPNGSAQREVLRGALADAQVQPSDVDYVEAHGTGTPLGDPVEVHALAEVYGEKRPANRPLLIGSVKTNIGHLESAAGMASLIKVVLSLQNREIPPQLHLERLNPLIESNAGSIRVVSERMPWNRNGHARIAGISSFGFSGTNAHIVVEEAPSAPAPLDKSSARASLLTLSAKSEAALKIAAERFAQSLENRAEVDWGSATATAAAGRAHFSHRCGVLASSCHEAAGLLRGYLRGENPPGVVARKAGRETRSKIAFLFTGQGSQFAGMGRGLYEAEPAFRRSFDRCDELFTPLLERSLKQIMFDDSDASSIHATGFAQPALCALEIALADLWRSLGIVPDVVIGHSIGELVAAYVAGAVELEDVVKLVSARGRLMQALPGGGSMAAVFAPETEVRRALEEVAADVDLAAVNGAATAVISGPAESVDRMLNALQSRGVSSQRLSVSHAFHSALMEPMLDDFRRAAARVQWRTPGIPIVSNVTGQYATSEQVASAEYWRDHVRNTVRFADGFATLWQEGFRTFIEIGPSPTLLPLARAAKEEAALWLPSMSKRQGDSQCFLESVAHLYAAGYPLDFERFFGARGDLKVRTELPTYPFQRTRYWIDESRRPQDRSAQKPAQTLPGRRLRSALKEMQFETEWSHDAPAFLREHLVYDQVVAPAAGYVALAAAGAREAFGGTSFTLEAVLIHEAMVLPKDERRPVQLILSPEGKNSAAFQILSLPANNAEWTLHVSGSVHSDGAAQFTPSEVTDVSGEATTGEAFYRRLSDGGIHLGPSFRWVERLWRARDRARAETRAPRVEDRSTSYVMHPGLIDVAFQMAGAFLSSESVDGATWVPVGFDRLTLTTPPDAPLDFRARISPVTNNKDAATVNVRSAAIEIENLHVRRPSRKSLLKKKAVRDERVYELNWQPMPVPSAPAMIGSWVVVGSSPQAERVVGLLGGRLGSATDKTFDGDSILYIGTSGPDVTGAARKDYAEALGILQVLLKPSQRKGTRLWLIPQGLGASVLHGLGRVIRLEHPEVWGGVLDLSPSATDSDWRTAAALLQSGTEEDWIQVRGGQCTSARLIACGFNPDSHPAWRGDSAYLVTGGFGGLGLELASWLAAKKVGRIVLAGRRAPSKEAHDVLAQLRETGVEISVEQVDVSDATQVASLIERITQVQNFAGVFHAAGVLDDGVLSRQTVERFAKVAGPKVQGAWHLHEHTRRLSLDFFVMFSSVASVLGSPGQSNYAAANAFMDALARHRRDEGQAALSINWGPWAQVGMAAAEGERGEARRASRGVLSLQPSAALKILESVLAHDAAQLFVGDFDWPKFLDQFPAGVQPLLLSAMVAESQAALATGAEKQNLDRLMESTPQAGKRDALTEYVRGLAARVLAFGSVQQVDVREPLHEMGLDSMMALDLTKLLGQAAGRRLPATLLFNNPTVEALAGFLADTVFGLAAAAVAPAAPSQRDETMAKEAAAIEQMSREEIEALLATELAELDELQL